MNMKYFHIFLNKLIYYKYNKRAYFAKHDYL